MAPARIVKIPIPAPIDRFILRGRSGLSVNRWIFEDIEVPAVYCLVLLHRMKYLLRLTRHLCVGAGACARQLIVGRLLIIGQSLAIRQAFLIEPMSLVGYLFIIG